MLSKNELLSSIGIDPETIIYPKEVFTEKNLNSHDYQGYEPTSIKNMYGKNDVSQYIMFLGDYLNWGYWDGINIDRTISNSDRIKASENLYEHIFNQLKTSKNSNVLEVGFGLGMGIKKLITNCDLNSITGIDFVPEQLERALKINGAVFKDYNVSLVTENIENSELMDKYFTDIYICEVAQHFSNIKAALQEIKRISKPGATIIIVAPFPCTKESKKKLETIIPYYEINMSKYDIEEIKKIMSEISFAESEVSSIGKHIWKGFDTWLSQQDDTKDQWSRVYYPAYQHGLIDYYNIKLTC